MKELKLYGLEYVAGGDSGIYKIFYAIGRVVHQGINYQEVKRSRGYNPYA
ncbi:hypothetical protein [Neisseria chenwenguii]|nr:hypothetical protein [Neisseria chenwenguii]